ncbi:MAG: SpoIIE family protein phosphatase [Spirochaetes bacterium]|nr:SpoIIE family protein phosphatase [Spirochaetota bacterium]
MNVQTIAQIIQSPLPIKLFLEIGFVIIFASLRKKDTEGYVNGFIAAVLLAVVRDALFALFPLPEICFISDIFLASLALFLFIAPYGSTLTLVLAMSVNLGFAILYTVDSVIVFMPDVPDVFFNSFLVLDVIALAAFSFIKRKDAETTTQLVLAGSYVSVSVIFAAYAVTVIWAGYRNVYLQTFAVPAFYGWFLVIGLRYFKVLDTQIIQASDYYESSINSLYNLMLSTGTALKESFAMDDILDSMNAAIMGETGATGGIVFLYDEFEDVIHVKSLRGVFPAPFALPENLPRKPNRIESYMKHLQLKPGETIFGEVAHTGKQIFIPETNKDPRIADNGEDESLRLSSLIVVPLMVEDRIIGVLSIAKSGLHEEFSEMDFDRAKVLANFGTLAVSNFFSFMEARERTVIDKSAGIAAEIQKTIIPKKLPDFTNVSFGAYTTPAKGVSGDYYDVIQTRKDRVVLAIGDVAGKGVSAALIMVMVRSILHLVTNTDRDVRTMLGWVNRGITGKIDIDSYATVGLLSVNVESGEVEYANANHLPILIFRKGMDTIETVEIKSLPIGVEKQTEYVKKVFRLEPGDVVVLYTDGVLESMNSQGKQYGRKNLGDIVAQYHALSAKDITGKIKNDLDAFVGSSRQHDDQTVLVMKMKQ